MDHSLETCYIYGDAFILGFFDNNNSINDEVIGAFKKYSASLHQLVCTGIILRDVEKRFSECPASLVSQEVNVDNANPVYAIR